MIKYEFNKSMQDDKHEVLAIEWLYLLKDNNVRRQADMQMLRSRIENLKSDIQIYHVSNKLKMQNLANKAKLDAPEIQEVEEHQTSVERSGEKSIDSGLMVNDQV